jgi:DNA-binding response OmpR family regulator
MRHRISDGYSDDIIALLAKIGTAHSTRVIILVPAGTPSAIEARQLRLGADCVLRDPIRWEVMLAYIEKYIATAEIMRGNERSIDVEFIGAMMNPGDRTLKIGARAVILTPREALLVELLSGHADRVVSYELLYSEILRRKFEGDTSNMRVLLAKLDASMEKIGLSLRASVKVIPKMGYKYERRTAPS